MRLAQYFSLSRRRPTLRVPEKFNRNSSTVTSLMSTEQSGCWLLERMRQQIGFESYADKKVLDFGCGVRFSQAIINTKLPFGRYVGIDVYREMIEFLRRNVRDRRFEYAFLNAHHPLFNPNGIALSAETKLPIKTNDFDIECMFSVLTHQYPEDTRNILAILRKHVASNGHLFFTCFLDDSIQTFADRSPDHNGGRCFYNPAYLVELVETCGWKVVRRAPSEGPIIADSFICQP